MEQAPLLDLPPERFDQTYRQHRHAVATAFCVAHGNLKIAEIDVFHPEPNAFIQPQTTAIKQVCHQTRRAVES